MKLIGEPKEVLKSESEMNLVHELKNELSYVAFDYENYGRFVKLNSFMKRKLTKLKLLQKFKLTMTVQMEMY